jgi:hypothetical protein
VKRLRPLAPPAALGLLLGIASVASVHAQDAGAPGKPSVQLAGIELAGSATAVGTEEQWAGALLEEWQERYGEWAALQAGPGQGGPGAGQAREGDQAGPGQAPQPGQAGQVHLRIEDAPAGMSIEVAYQPPRGTGGGAHVLVWGRSLQACVQAAAGEVAFLLAGSIGFPPPRLPAPRLAGIVSLDSLALLRGGPGAPTEALGLSAGPDGVRILLAGRFVSLGPLLEVSQQTAGDLLFAPPFPQGFVPTVLSTNALGEPAVYDADSGAILLYPCGSDAPERFDTGITQPMQAGELAGGTLAILQGQRLLLLGRRADRLQATELSLPTGLPSALSAERPGPFRVYDLAERRIRLLDAAGREVGSVKPLLGAGSLPLPQVFRTLPEGGYLLGGSSELWSLTSTGLVRWHLREVGTTPRESLPAFFSIAAAPGRQGGPQGVYLLDPLGRRLMKFVDPIPAGEAGGAGPGSAATLEELLAEGYERLAADPDSRSELIGLCLREGLLLQAHYLFTLSEAGSEAARGLEERFLAKQAERLAELARSLEEQLRLPEAEQAYNGALALLRELRGIDPVERRFPEQIRDLTEARNAVREVLVAEPLLEAGPLAVVPVDQATTGGTLELRVELRNRSARRLDDLVVDARLASGPGAPTFLQRRWSGSLGSLPPRGRQRLAIPISSEGQAPLEDLRVQLHLLVSCRQGTEASRQHLALPALLPLGSSAVPVESGGGEP